MDTSALLPTQFREYQEALEAETLSPYAVQSAATRGRKLRRLTPSARSFNATGTESCTRKPSGD